MEKEASKSKIPDIIKRNAAPLIIMGVSALLAAVVVFSLLFTLRFNNTAKFEEKIDPALITDEISKNIKIVMFNSGLRAADINEYTSFDNTTVFYRAVITAESDKLESLKQSVLHILNEQDVSTVYADDSMFIAGGIGDSYKVEIELEQKNEPRGNDDSVVSVIEQEPVGEGKSATPGKNIPDGVNYTHLGSSSYPFGVTPPPPGSGKIAILVDDAGANLVLAEKLLKKENALTIAILPHLQYSRQTAELTRRMGACVFLHYPMEPLSYPATDPGPGAVFVDMSEDDIFRVTRENMSNVGYVDGVNNHTGSAFTENAAQMEIVLRSLEHYTNVFVDSRTSTKSRAYDMCRKNPVFKCGLNIKFLDNMNDAAYITGKLYEAANVAARDGEVIAIGHLKHETVAVLEVVMPFLRSLGYEFVHVTDLTR